MDGGEQQPSLTSHELKELKRKEKLEQRQQQSAAAHDVNKKKRTKTYVVSAVAIVLVVGALWLWSQSGITGAATIDASDHPTAGTLSAPVRIIVFGDFQCPFTRKFWQGAFPKILEKYSGNISVTYWPVPTAKHNYDRASAEAAYCANEQGKFWEYAKLLFDRQGAATDGNLRDYARELQMDTAAFNSCYDSGRYKDKVQEDYTQGRKFGVVQTPTLAINEHWLSGELPFGDYQTFIEYELQ